MTGVTRARKILRGEQMQVVSNWENVRLGVEVVDAGSQMGAGDAT